MNIKDVPKDMKNAVLATEDNRFYQHGALDYKRLFGAIGKNLTGGFVRKVRLHLHNKL